MNNNRVIIGNQSPSRRKFVGGVGILSLLAAVGALVRIPFPGKRAVISCAPEGKKKTVKMLTQDGTLVEVDESVITSPKKKVSVTEMQNWIKKQGETK
jgi:hypothetical protein